VSETQHRVQNWLAYCLNPTYAGISELRLHNLIQKISILLFKIQIEQEYLGEYADSKAAGVDIEGENAC
jgi:hypothetical protein